MKTFEQTLKRYLKFMYRVLFAKINIIDVGSVGGLPSPWKEQYHQIKYLLSFEPREQKGMSPLVIKRDSVLWEIEENRDFYIYKGFEGTGSSLFKQNFEYVENNYDWLSKRGPKGLAESWFDRSEVERTDIVNCKKLDDILQNIHLPIKFNFLKIDAQGAEFQILRGAENFLSSSCLGLHLELFVLPLYEGIHLLPAVVDYLERFDFQLVKKYPAHGTFNSQHDCVFLKRGIQGKAIDIVRDLYQI